MASESPTSPPMKLTDDQHARLEEFIKLCGEKGYLKKPEGLGDEDANDGINCNVTLLRFLRARSFDIDGAIKQFEDALNIRNAVNATTLYDNVELPAFEQGQHATFPRWYGCRDKRGFPICYFILADFDLAIVDEYNQEKSTWPSGANLIEKRNTCLAAKKSIVAHDYLTRFVLPLCSAAKDRPDPDVPVTGAVYLIDMEVLGWRIAWRLKDIAADLTKVLETCYPEVIDKIYIIKAPSYIDKMWAIFAKFIDPRTAAKIVFVPYYDTLSTLQSFTSIESIPTNYGGKFDLKKSKSPIVDDGLLEALDWVSPQTSIPTGPMKWIDESSGKRAAVAVGQVEGTQRSDQVAVLNS